MKKMAKINSRNKGAAFERDIAKILNEFFIEEGIDYQTKRNLDQYQQKESVRSGHASLCSRM